MHSRIVAITAAVVALGLSMACESENGGSLGAGNGTGGNGTGGTGASASEFEVTTCKSSCDKLKFFDCNDSLDQAGCYANCEAASPSQIELFNGCVSTDTCDPTCSTTIEPKAAEPGGGTGGTGGTGGSSGGSTTGGEPEPKNPVEECQAGCDHLKFFGCLSAEDQAACRDLCPSAKDADRDNFTACAASGCDAACYKSLDPSFVPKASEFDQKKCDSACDGYKFFDCIGAAEHSVCVDLCKTAPADEVNAFSGCAGGGGDCDTIDCLDAFSQN